MTSVGTSIWALSNEPLLGHALSHGWTGALAPRTVDPCPIGRILTTAAIERLVVIGEIARSEPTVILRSLCDPRRVLLGDGRLRVEQHEPTDQPGVPHRTCPSYHGDVPAEHGGSLTARRGDHAGKVFGPLLVERRVPIGDRIGERDPPPIEHDEPAHLGEPFEEPIRHWVLEQGVHREEVPTHHHDFVFAAPVPV